MRSVNIHTAMLRDLRTDGEDRVDFCVTLSVWGGSYSQSSSRHSYLLLRRPGPLPSADLMCPADQCHHLSGTLKRKGGSLPDRPAQGLPVLQEGVSGRSLASRVGAPLNPPSGSAL